MLIELLVAVVIIGLIFYVISLIPLPPPWRTIAYVILAVIVIVYLLRLLGVATIPL